jgi:glutamate racemase
MSNEFLEISFHVFVDGIQDRIYSRIIEEIGTIAPEIIKTRHTQSTNIIDVLAHWNESRVDESLKVIKKIANVSDVIIEREKHVKNFMEPTIKLTDCFSWTVKEDPIAEIIMALNAKNYYEAISLTCTVFQYLGKEILSCQAKNMGMVSKTTDLNSVINGLLVEKLIDVNNSEIIQQARKLQKIYQRKERGIKFSFDKSQVAELTILHSLECINFLKNKYYSILDKKKENNGEAVNSIELV